MVSLPRQARSRRRGGSSTREDRPRKKILLVVNSSWNIVNFRAGVVRALLARGYSVIVAAPRDEYTAAVEALGCDFVELPMQAHGRSPARELLLLARLLRLIGRERPDRVLAYTPKPNVYASLAARPWRVPVINNIPGLGLVFNESGGTARILRMLYRVALRRSAAIFFQNAHDMALFVDSGLVPGRVAALLPGSGVDLDRFAPEPMPAGSFVFLLVARLLWEKGIAEYVEAGRAVRALYPEVRLRILGFIDDRSAAAVPRERIEAWHAEGAIDYVGSASDVRPHLAAADCVVLPSYYREGTPRTLLEAAAMGKPIITSDMPGCRDVVEDGRNGFIVVPRDASALAQRMREMIELPPAARQAMGAASRAKAEREYDERIVVRKYLAAIDSGPADAGRSGG